MPLFKIKKLIRKDQEISDKLLNDLSDQSFIVITWTGVTRKRTDTREDQTAIQTGLFCFPAKDHEKS